MNEKLENGNIWKIEFPDMNYQGRMEKLEHYSKRPTIYSAVTSILAERNLKFMWGECQIGNYYFEGFKEMIDKEDFDYKQIPEKAPEPKIDISDSGTLNKGPEQLDLF